MISVVAKFVNLFEAPKDVSVGFNWVIKDLATRLIMLFLCPTLGTAFWQRFWVGVV